MEVKVMYFFSIYEFKEKWAEMSAQEQQNFFILIGVTILIIVGIGIFDYIRKKKKQIDK